MGLESVCVSMFGWTVRLLQLLIPAETAVPRKYQQNLSYKPVSFPPLVLQTKRAPFACSCVLYPLFQVISAWAKMMQQIKHLVHKSYLEEAKVVMGFKRGTNGKMMKG